MPETTPLMPPPMPSLPALGHFQAQTQAAHAFQVVMDLPFQRVDSFAATRPCVVSARTLLSQLL